MPLAKKIIILEKVGLGDIAVSLKYGAPLIGELIEWSHEQMPQEIWPDMTMEFIPYMAQSFDPVKYPLLSQLHPTNTLPADMRGQFVRGWNNGADVDPDRELLSAQGDAIRNITGNITNGFLDSMSAGGVFNRNGTTTGSGAGGNTASKRSIDMDVSTQVPTADENRPVNVAWNLIVRAK